ncbi:hypothetical protein [Pelobacter seleniigenes]|uniref:hypothetical protein n=1 Tax=Pelobacter seleniigenes TaxID=407188 RepID=UPI0004A73E20|nr:hypothetical protein [Pelobacter seleniigenes]
MLWIYLIDVQSGLIIKFYQESLKLPKIIATALLVMLALTVAGCAKKVEPIRVKCPACGYEFDVQPEG